MTLDEYHKRACARLQLYGVSDGLLRTYVPASWQMYYDEDGEGEKFPEEAAKMEADKLGLLA